MNENAMRDMRAEDGLNAVPLDKFFENQIVKATGDVTAVPDGKAHPTVLNQIAAQMGVNPRSTLEGSDEWRCSRCQHWWRRFDHWPLAGYSHAAARY